MKKKMLVVGGSVGAVVLLILAMLTTVVSAQTVKSGFAEWFSEAQPVAVSDKQIFVISDILKTYGSGPKFQSFTPYISNNPLFMTI